MSQITEVIRELRAIADILATIAKQQPPWTASINTLLNLANRLEQNLTPTALTPYSQRDPRWRDCEYAPGYTLGRYGCYITCVTMLASLAGYTDTPPQAAANLKHAKAITGSYLKYPERIPTVYPNLKWSGSLDWRDKPADLPRLKQELESGPVIIEVEFRPGGTAPPIDQHFVLAKSFTADEHDLLIIDPWDGATTRLLERYALDHWDLARTIYGARLLKVKKET